MNIEQQQGKPGQKNNEDGLLAKLQPGKDRITALQKVIATLNANPKKTLEDEVSIKQMQQEINNLVSRQTEIMNEFDNKYSTQQINGVITIGKNGFDNFEGKDKQRLGEFKKIA